MDGWVGGWIDGWVSFTAPTNSPAGGLHPTIQQTKTKIGNNFNSFISNFVL